jgi:septum formation protein
MKPIVLASRSPARGRLLAAAGISFSTDPADVEEAAEVQNLVAAGQQPGAIALRLARQKAQVVAERHPDALVVGADQTLEIEGGTMMKPATVDEARSQLKRLRGRRHNLHSAVACVSDAGTWWHVESASLVMRPFSDAFLEEYLVTCGRHTLESVGAYHLEGYGVQLFQKIEGDFFTILGMPLIPLLDHLRTQRVLLT